MYVHPPLSFFALPTSSSSSCLHSHITFARGIYRGWYRSPWFWWETSVTWQNKESFPQSKEMSSPASLEGVPSLRPPLRTRLMWSKYSMTSSAKSTARILDQQARKRRKVVAASCCEDPATPWRSSPSTGGIIPQLY